MKRHLCVIAALGMCWVGSITVAYAQVRADSGGIAIGGSVTGSTVIIGIPQEKVDELVRDAKRPLEELTSQQRENIALLKDKLDLNERQVRAALGILGENDIAPERLAAKLVEIAERFKNLQATASAQLGDDPKIAALKADAQKAIDAGDLAKADALLATVETEQKHGLDHLAVSVAETSARRGEIALTRLRYAEAAMHFATAAGVFPPGSINEEKRINYLSREAIALHQQGDELGDNSALVSAIERCRRLVDLTSRERAPLDWAKAQNNLGHALQTLGERESGTANLEEAIVAYREALKEHTRERVPLGWAVTQRNLGVALTRLGERESGAAKLQEAAVAFREALKEHTRERVPLDWARTQSNLAVALTRLGERENGTAKWEEAVAAFREALKELTRERAPLQWATIQNNVGVVLFNLGGLEGGTAKFEEAGAAFREALKEHTRERVPLLWAMTQNNLGNALALLGQRGKLEEAIAAYREALKEHTRERVPLQWATIQSNMGVALFKLGGLEGGTAEFEEAVNAFREALKERTRERVPIDWATSLGGQGMALTDLAERRGDSVMAESALGQINTAFETMRDGGNTHTAAYLEKQLLKAGALVARLRAQ